MKRLKQLPEFVRFVMVGIFATALHYGLYFVLQRVINVNLCSYLLHMGLLNLSLWMGIPKPLAPIPVFAIAIPVNFLLVRFVFKRKE